ncbi:hypothetical protein [Aureimonas leprariae]|uniref:Uncharacterized protein n=1 Tax=Plantimonas leprariae TaxID=2615207 RepID=A0A7V7TUU1_9HYPH|nr:hypothetical protein [Aureimonas leprariae]KAB0676672.1 hypothetical protein F6X38_20415 [Aureimonas leprariae]
MTLEPETHAFVDQSMHTASARIGNLHPLQQASLRIAEFRDGRSAFKARDLVGLLLSHGARAYRASQPVTVTRLRVRSPEGTVAVRLRVV